MARTGCVRSDWLCVALEFQFHFYFRSCLRRQRLKASIASRWPLPPRVRNKCNTRDHKLNIHSYTQTKNDEKIRDDHSDKKIFPFLHMSRVTQRKFLILLAIKDLEIFSAIGIKHFAEHFSLLICSRPGKDVKKKKKNIWKDSATFLKTVLKCLLWGKRTLWHVSVSAHREQYLLPYFTRNLGQHKWSVRNHDKHEAINGKMLLEH